MPGFEAAPMVRNDYCNYVYKQAVPLEREFSQKKDEKRSGRSRLFVVKHKIKSISAPAGAAY